MSAIEMFATKSSSSKPDKNSSDKPRDAKTVKDNEVSDAVVINICHDQQSLGIMSECQCYSQSCQKVFQKVFAS